MNRRHTPKVTVTLTADILKGMKLHQQRLGISRSALIRVAVVEWIRSQQSPQDKVY